MHNSITILPAAPDDAATLAKFSRRTFIDAFAHLNNQQDFNTYVSKAFTQEQILSELRDPGCFFFIARMNGKWAGYAKLECSFAPASVKVKPAIELSRLYSLQETLGIGIGFALMKKCIAHARSMGFKSIWLGSWKKNHRGNAFYHKMGFSIAGSKTFTLGSDVQEDHLFVKTFF